MSETDFFTSSTASGNLRAVASSRATVSSAVASVRTSGVYPTRMPLLRAKSDIIVRACSMLLYPWKIGTVSANHRFLISSRAKWSNPTDMVLITFKLGPKIKDKSAEM